MRSGSAASGVVTMGDAGAPKGVPVPSGDETKVAIGGPDAGTRHHDKLPGGRVSCPSRRVIAFEGIRAAVPLRTR
jgi:hypothetical protein